MVSLMMIILVDVIQHSYTRRPATRTGVAQLRIEADQPLTFSDQHSPRLSALAQAIMETLF